MKQLYKQKKNKKSVNNKEMEKILKMIAYAIIVYRMEKK